MAYLFPRKIVLITYLSLSWYSGGTDIALKVSTRMQKQGKGKPCEVWSLQLQTQEGCPRQAQPLPEECGERPLPTAAHQCCSYCVEPLTCWLVLLGP